jgi:hypothetical protein
MPLRFRSRSAARAGAEGRVEVGAYLPFLDAPPQDGLSGWSPAGAIGDEALHARERGVEEALAARLPGAEIGRVYVGTETCDRRLPSRGELAAWTAAAKDAGVGLTLVLPPLGGRTIEAGVARAAALEAVAGAEVVANDWGTVHALRARLPSLPIVLGRLTNKMLRDPRLADRFDAPEAPAAARDALCQSGAATPGHRRLLERYGIRRREVDPVLQPIAEAEWRGCSESITVHLPYLFVTCGRACLVGGRGRERRDKFVPGGDCAFECRTEAIELEVPAGDGRSTRLLSLGNGLYHAVPPATASRHLEDLAPVRPVDRVVLLVPATEPAHGQDHRPHQ